MNFDTVKQNLENKGFAVSVFENKEDAARYLNAKIDGKTVGFGGSVTLHQLDLHTQLAQHNTLYSHWDAVDKGADALIKAAHTEVYLSSVNGLAESGELINIDGLGNRVSSIQFGHKEVYLVVGRNKLAPDFDSALYRARNVAAPKNAQRLGRKTPCAAKGERCYDCNSPERICRGLSVLWYKPTVTYFEIVLIDEELGY